MGDVGVGSGSVESGCHQLSENIWFVWSKTSFGGDNGDVTMETKDERKVKSAPIMHKILSLSLSSQEDSQYNILNP